MPKDICSFNAGAPTVSQQFTGTQDLGALVRVCDVQLVEVRLLQSRKVLQGLETVHGQQRTQLLKQKTTNANI